MLLRGRTDRVLVPAELLALPREPVDDFPRDPFGQADARAKQLATAKVRATAYLDGEVAKEADVLRVSLVLRAAGGAEIGRREGRSTLLYRSVADAIDALRGAGP